MNPPADSPGVRLPTADAVVVAFGSSARMAGIDKLDAQVAGRSILAHALAGLAVCPDVASIVLVADDARAERLRVAGWMPAKVTRVVPGGARRQDSVRAGFAALDGSKAERDGDRIVLVHDGGRPIVSDALVSSLVQAARAWGAAIPLGPVVDTVKRVADGLVVGTLDRGTLGLAQTPQAFQRSVLRRALALVDAAGGDRVWTDEAALLEACDIAVHALPGDPANLKVTVPADVERAAATLGPAIGHGSAGRIRTGIGHDSHPFGPGDTLWLGGLAFAGVPRLHGHSDGDAALHAVADALLGAAGAGDLGRLFPADASTPAGIASRDLLGAVVRLIAQAGWRPTSVDLVITAARPRLATRLEAMGGSIAELLGIAPSAVNVKASTGNLDGADGAGRTISVVALASVEAIR